ncbi:DUF3825 domain-containing protein [Olsenella sp. YH-ols2223]|uniref:DUF3825 domain-containing protein n=1 Tax=Olsenella absiana TaxID=3115222 RepID=A0ABU7R9B6_9ACTN
MTPGNKLYFYRLLSERFGFGRQTFVTHVEEVLAEDGLSAADLGIASTRELLEMLDEFVTILDFKGGRSYVRIERLPDWDKYLEAAEDDKDRKAAGGKPWRKGRQPKGARPTRPKCVRKAKKPAEPEAVAAPAEPEAVAVPLEPEAVAAPAEPEAVAAPVEPEAVTGDAAEKPAEPEAASGEDVRVAPASSEEPASEAAADEAPADEAPTAEAEVDGEDGTAEAPARPSAEPTTPTSFSAPAAPAAPTASAAPAAPVAPVALPIAVDEAPDLRGIPTDFTAEVHLPTRLAGALARALPFDANLPKVLDEDWAYAVSTGAVRGSRTRVSFPLRYLHADGTPIELALAHGKADPTGRSWRVERVDDDATGAALEAAGPSGCPVEAEPWELLVPARRDFEERVSVRREFASLVAIPSWDALVGALASACAPDGWRFEKDGDVADSHGLLRYYLCATVFRIRRQGRLVQDASGRRAALDTGLRDPRGLDVYLVLKATEEGGASGVAAPWTADAVVAADPLADERPAALAAFGELPLPASYLDAAEGLVPALDAKLELDLGQIALHQLSRLPRAFLEEALAESPRTSGLLAKGSPDDLGRAVLEDEALLARLATPIERACRRALRSAALGYRPCVPAYVPATDAVVPLLPVALAGDAIDCCVALRPSGDGTYAAGAFLSLADARACARPACACPPAWLL